MNASGLMQIWWLWIPLMAGATACTPAWGWSWALTLQLAILGTEWAYVGATSLGQWPEHRVVVAAAWVYVALLLAGAANLNRMYQHYREWKRHLWLAAASSPRKTADPAEDATDLGPVG
jgi:hypothetical protein